jgi:hypothetical protein
MVAIHVTLAAALWAVTLQFLLGLTARPEPSTDAGDEPGAGDLLLAPA